MGKVRTYGNGMLTSPRLMELKELLLTRDQSMKEIAYLMKLSDATCKIYRARLYEQLKVRNGRTSLFIQEIERLKAILDAKESSCETASEIK